MSLLDCFFYILDKSTGRAESLISFAELAEFLRTDLTAIGKAVKSETIVSKDSAHPQHKEGGVGCHYELHVREHVDEIGKDFKLMHSVQMQVNLVNKYDSPYIGGTGKPRSAQVEVGLEPVSSSRLEFGSLWINDVFGLDKPAYNMRQEDALPGTILPDQHDWFRGLALEGKFDVQRFYRPEIGQL